MTPKKETLLLFFFSVSVTQRERPGDINPLEEKQLFSARGGRVLLPSTRSLLEGSFVWGWILRLIACIGVVVKLSRGDLSLWCQWWPGLRPEFLGNRTLVCVCDGHQSELSLGWCEMVAQHFVFSSHSDSGLTKGLRFYKASSVVHHNSTCWMNTCTQQCGLSQSHCTVALGNCLLIVCHHNHKHHNCSLSCVKAQTRYYYDWEYYQVHTFVSIPTSLLSLL